jgi:(1->4)-alpha-D-glucan 1-alpha-D-glucosylmutase
LTKTHGPTNRSVAWATYRLQLAPGFGFEQAAALAAYLADLGVTHLYASPYLQAAKGSAHGYDVVDHSKVNDELGGEEGRHRMVQELDRLGLSQLLDIVPNHMAIGDRANRWWWDVLENGFASSYAPYFDVDWERPLQRPHNRIILPVLSDHYGRLLEKGMLFVRREAARAVLCYKEADQCFPLCPETVGELVEEAAARCGRPRMALLGRFLRETARGDHHSSENGHLEAGPLEASPDRQCASHRSQLDREVLYAMLEELLTKDPAARAAYDEVLSALNADLERLDKLVSRQHYRPAYWKLAQSELDYRRFFDVNHLVGLRTELPEVFHAIHQRVLGWVQEGSVQGLRVDHPDGLRDPSTYLQQLAEAAPGAWIVVEKILAPEEELPANWPVQGTTGYDFLALVNRLWVDPAAEQALTDTYRELTGEERSFEEIAAESKRQVLEETLSADLDRLVERLAVAADHQRSYRDFSRGELRDALVGLLVAMPVYRTYVSYNDEAVRDSDYQAIMTAVAKAKLDCPHLDKELLDWIGDLLVVPSPGERRPDLDLRAEEDFVLRFQQLSAATMAKGVEDTAFYRFNRFIALNEVGSNPSIWSAEPEEFHRFCLRAKPLSLLATSTHDTKRSEDVRARLAVLSEVPAEWKAAVQRWFIRNSELRQDGVPDADTEYFLYQTMVGTWPISKERLVSYMLKAAKESKRHTSWIHPDPAYDRALVSFVEQVLANEDFIADLEGFVASIDEAGRVNSLSQVALKCTAPGVPDIYQGTELWDHSLVDPDNRRPVDWQLRRRLLEALESTSSADLAAMADVGLPKLALLRACLHLRRSRPEAFAPGASYEPLPVEGEGRHVIGFSRERVVVCVVPRLWHTARRSGALGRAWVELPKGNWRNIVTRENLKGGRQSLEAITEAFPVLVAERC